MKATTKNVMTSSKDLLEFLIDCTEDYIHELNNELTRLKFIEKGKISNSNIMLTSHLDCANKYLKLFNDIIEDIKKEERNNVK